MDDPQLRRRKTVTYGKGSARKRPSAFDDIFSSPTSTNPSSTTPPHRQDSRIQPSFRNKTRPPDPNHSPPLDTAKPTRTAAAAADPDPDQAADAQLLTEARQSRNPDVDLFDLPSSDIDEPSARRPRKRKRVASVPSVPATKPRSNSDDLTSTTTATTTDPYTDTMTAKHKRSRTRPDEETTGSSRINTLTATSKITKPGTSRTTQKGPSRPHTLVASPEQAKVHPPVRVTRSASRQLSEEPSSISVQPYISEKPRAKKKKFAVVIKNAEDKAPVSTRRNSTIIKPLIQPNLNIIPEEIPEPVTPKQTCSENSIENNVLEEKARTDVVEQTAVNRKKAIMEDSQPIPARKPSSEKITPRNSQSVKKTVRKPSSEKIIAENLQPVVKHYVRKPSADQVIPEKPQSPPAKKTARRNSTEKKAITEESPRSPVKQTVAKKSNVTVKSRTVAEPTPATNNRKRLIDTLGGGGARSRKKSRSPTSTDISTGAVGINYLEDSFGSKFQESSQPPEASREVNVISVHRQTLSGRAGPKITYARERSYRTEESGGSLEAMLSMPLPAIKSMEPVRRRLEAPKPFNGGESKEVKKPKTTIKTIHELRATGEHNRFVDDVEDLLLDIEGNCALSTKRSGYFELANKLRDKSFSHKFRTNSFDERLLTKMDQQTDEIISFTLLYIALCFIEDDSTPRTMLQVCQNGIMSILTWMLKSSRDITVVAKDRASNMSKIALSQVADLRALVEKSAAFSGEGVKVISSQVLALKVMDLLVRRFRAHGSTDEILSKSALRGLVDILLSFSDSKEYPKILKTQGLQLLELPVSTLEAYTMGGYGSLESHLSTDELGAFAKLFTVVSGWDCEENLAPILLLLLRMNINITNNRPLACEKLADSSLIGSLVVLIKKKFGELSGVLGEQERLLSVDLLVLSLGLMMNFAELSSKARTAIGDKVITAVEGNPMAIDILLDIFLERLESTAEASSMEETQSNVAFGYLAVLLGDLCQEDHIRYKARGRLPNSDLKSLLGAIEEFIAHHRKVDEHMFGVEEEEFGGDEKQQETGQHAPVAEFTGRLQEVMMRLRAYA